MTIAVGIGLAFVAMLCWGFGDFLIQRSTRKLGDWETLFVLTLFGSVVLLPFVYKSIPSLFAGSPNSIMILVSASVFLLFAALLNMEAFKKGKLSVLEPLLSLEIISASFLAFFILSDKVTWLQIIVIILLIISLFLVSFNKKYISKRFFIEKGVLIFSLGAFLMGFTDFLLGWGSRLTDPLIATFVMNTVITVVSGISIVVRGGAGKLIRDIYHNPPSIMAMAISENIAWVAYAFAMVLVPIAVATGLSESSIIIAVSLGIFINKEKLQMHQKVGLVGAVVSAIILAVITTA